MKFKQEQIAVLAAVWLAAATATAQVTIGADTSPNSFSVLELESTTTKGGLRLPQLEESQKKPLEELFKSPTVPDAQHGLVIYNKTTKCVEYWNGNQWISLCDGTGNITVWPVPEKTMIAADGKMTYFDEENKEEEVEDNEFAASTPGADPDVVVRSRTFSYAMLVGSEYASVTDELMGQGLFSVEFAENNSIHPRVAILRITNNKDGSYKDFMYTQKGQSCGTKSAPNIKTTSEIPADRKLALCKESAVYLWVDDLTNLDSLIWVRNGVEIARGVNHIIVTQPGKYDVNMTHVGCTNNANNVVTVERCDNVAPHAVTILVAGNNGTLCSSTGQVTLWAKKTGTETVRWFKNGELQPLTTPDDSETGATKGTWFAVVEGTDCLGNKCYSLPSESVTVSEELNNSKGSLDSPNLPSFSTFDEGSTQIMKISNATNTDYVGATFTWYADNTEIGTGVSITYSVPKGVKTVIIRCRVTKPDWCAAEGAKKVTVTSGTGNIPPMPVISGERALCDGEATLNIVPTGLATNYYWFKDGKLVSEDQQYDIYEGGDYYAAYSYSNGGSLSPMAHINIPLEYSTFPGTTFSADHSHVVEGNTITFTAKDDYATINEYKWDISGSGASIVSGGKLTDKTITVKFETKGSVYVKLVGSNICGDSPEFSTEITVVESSTTSCKTTVTSVTPSAATSKFTTLNNAVTLSVSATFSDKEGMPTYEWYSSKTQITSAPGVNLNKIDKATKDTYIAPASEVGKMWYYCKVSTCSGTGNAVKYSGVYEVEVIDLPTKIGAGTFTGRTAFDIAKTDCNGTTAESRKDRRADFNLRDPQDPQKGNIPAPYSGVQVYTFTPSGTVSNVSFAYKDPSDAIESIEANQSNPVSGLYKVTVTYKKSLQNTLKGTAPLTPVLYVIYNNGTEKVMIPLTIHLQDCVACGAYTDQGGWLTFMCHNLGADNTLEFTKKIEVTETVTTESSKAHVVKGGTLFSLGILGHDILSIGDGLKWVSAFDGLINLGKKVGSVWNMITGQEEEKTVYLAKRSNSILGDLYQWGRLNDGHQGISEITETRSTTINTTGNEYFIRPTVNKNTTKTMTNMDWYSGTIDKATRWGNGTDDLNVPKAVNDPCPQGWKVPSRAQWRSIIGQGSSVNAGAGSPNKWTWKVEGYKVGDALFLPAANRRIGNNGLYEEEKNGVVGYYWSSTYFQDKVSAISFDRYEIKPDNTKYYPAEGMSVRCVSE